MQSESSVQGWMVVVAAESELTVELDAEFAPNLPSDVAKRCSGAEPSARVSVSLALEVEIAAVEEATSSLREPRNFTQRELS